MAKKKIVEPPTSFNLKAQSLGEVAYGAYQFGQQGEKDTIIITAFEALDTQSQAAWQATGDAVAAHVGREDVSSRSVGHYEGRRRAKQGA